MNKDLTYLQNNNNIKLENRKKLELTGVKKISSLNEEEFIVDTVLGIVTIKGENLEMINLNIDKGVLLIGGKINSIIYDKEIKTKQKKQSFLGKVFRWYIQSKKKYLFLFI